MDTNFDDYYRLFQESYESFDYEQARPYLEKLLAQSRQNSAEQYWKYSMCLYELGECADALKVAEQATFHYPSNREFNYIKGKIYFDIGLFADSLINFNRFIKIRTTFLSSSEMTIMKQKTWGYLCFITASKGLAREAQDYWQLLVDEEADLLTIERLVWLCGNALSQQSLVSILAASKVINKNELVPFLCKIGAYEACLDVINQAGIENEFILEWLRCQLYLGKYIHVQQKLNVFEAPFSGDMIMYYCLSRWLQSPRLSAGDFLIKQNNELNAVQACLWVNDFIFGDGRRPIDKTDRDLRKTIKEIALIAFRLDDISLALEIISKYDNGNEKQAYAELGGEALNSGWWEEARTCLERGLGREKESAQDYFRLGTVCRILKNYDQALEHFIRAIVIEPQNRLYPHLAYEAAAAQAIKILSPKSEVLAESQTLTTELLRLLTIKNKSKRLRKIMNLTNPSNTDDRSQQVV